MKFYGSALISWTKENFTGAVVAAAGRVVQIFAATSFLHNLKFGGFGAVKEQFGRVNKSNNRHVEQWINFGLDSEAIFRGSYAMRKVHLEQQIKDMFW